MSEKPPDDGGTPPPTPPPPEPPRGGFMPVAAGLGLIFLYVVGLSMIPALGPMGPYGAPASVGITYWSIFIAYLVIAVVLAVRRRTSRTGAGLLIAFGIWLLVGGEVCVGVLFQMRQA